MSSPDLDASSIHHWFSFTSCKQLYLKQSDQIHNRFDDVTIRACDNCDQRATSRTIQTAFGLGLPGLALVDESGLDEIIVQGIIHRIIQVTASVFHICAEPNIPEYICSEVNLRYGKFHSQFIGRGSPVMFLARVIIPRVSTLRHARKMLREKPPQYDVIRLASNEQGKIEEDIEEP